jgi:hypothetical protein
LPLSPVVQEALASRTDSINRDAERYQATEPRESFETASGITIHGAAVYDVVTSSNYATEFEQDGVWQIRISGEPNRDVRPDEPCTALVRISHARWSGCWIALPVFPGLIAAVLIDEDGFSSLDYRPSRYWGAHDTPAHGESGTILAHAAAMFRYGLMPSRQRAHEMIDTIRRNPTINPALAIVAAHVCLRLGDHQQIADIARHGWEHFMPYDLHLLSAQVQPAGIRSVVGTFPFMSPSWALLSAGEVEFDERLLGMVGGLLPCLWTMANPVVGAQLAEFVRPGVSLSYAPITTPAATIASVRIPTDAKPARGADQVPAHSIEPATDIEAPAQRQRPVSFEEE